MKIVSMLLFLGGPVLAQEQVWTWIDETGEEHYTNDKSTVPEKFRAKARSTDGDELSVVKTREAAAEPKSAPVLAPPQPQAPAVGAPTRVVVFEAATNSGSKTLNRSGVIEKLIANNPGLKLERVELSTALERAEKLKVTQVPTVLFLDDSGAVVARVSGLVTLKELQQHLDRARETSR